MTVTVPRRARLMRQGNFLGLIDSKNTGWVSDYVATSSIFEYQADTPETAPLIWDAVDEIWNNRGLYGTDLALLGAMNTALTNAGFTGPHGRPLAPLGAILGDPRGLYLAWAVLEVPSFVLPALEPFIAQAASFWLAPTSQGTATGLSSANAMGITVVDAMATAISTVGPGGVIELRSDLGTYSSINPYTAIASGGTVTQPITIRGPRPADGGKAVLSSNRTNPWVFGAAEPGDEIFQLTVGANNLIFAYMDIQNAIAGWQSGAPVSNIQIAEMVTSNCQRVFDTKLLAGQTDATVVGLVMKNIASTRGTKGDLRLDFNSRNIRLTNWTTDALGVDGDLFVMAFQFLGTTHDVVLTEVHAKNGFYNNGVVYWNADGFVSEETTYDITLIDCSASGFTDGGIDMKADDLTITRFNSHDNKRNFRLWGSRVVMTDCKSSHPNLRGGTGTQAHVQTAKRVGFPFAAEVTINNLTAIDYSPSTISFDADSTSIMNINSATLTRETTSTLQTKETGAAINGIANITETLVTAIMPTAEARYMARKYIQTGSWIDLSVGHELAKVGTPVFVYNGSDSLWQISNTNYLSTPDDALLDFNETDEFTIMARVRVSAFPAAEATILAKKTDLGTAAGWALSMGVTGIPTFRLGDGTLQPADSGTTMALNTWAVLVGRRNATHIECFVNGSSVASTADSTTATLANALAMTVGACATGTVPWAGDISDVAVWRSALTNQQITDLTAQVLAAKI